MHRTSILQLVLQKCEANLTEMLFTKREEAKLNKGLFTWSGGPRSSGVGFFCFHALGDTKQKKLTPLDRGPPLHVNRVLNSQADSTRAKLFDYK